MCLLLEKARENQGGITYYEVSKRLGISTPLMHLWKNNKSKPNGIHTLKLAEMAGVDIKEAIRLVENGFINLSLLLVTGFSSAMILLVKFNVWELFIHYTK